MLQRLSYILSLYVVCAQVYSEVGGVLHIELWDKSDPSCSVFINKKLVEENLATFCEESPSSQVRAGWMREGVNLLYN